MKVIRRVAGFGPWAVAAALGLDIADPVHAAPPTGRPVVRATSVALPAVADDFEAATNVQIAWLADPGLFLYSLSAQPTAKGIEIRGFVASEPAHQKAVAIARALCSGPVIDQLKLHVGMPIQLSRGATPAELAPVASSALAEALGDKVLGLRVVCPSAGRVEITGSVPTLEDKLLVSKCMKTLSGCTHVVNRTSAPGSAAGAAIVANIPLMMTMPAKDGSDNLKTISDNASPMPDSASPTPAVVNHPMSPPAFPVPVKNEVPTPPTRMVVNTPVRNSSDYKLETKMAVVPPPPATPGYSQVYETKPAEKSPTLVEAVRVPEPSWPPMNLVTPTVVTEPKAPESKPVELTKATSSTPLPEVRSAKMEPALPEIRSSKMEPVRPTNDKPQVLHLLPETPKVPVVIPPVEQPAPPKVPAIMPPVEQPEMPKVPAIMPPVEQPEMPKVPAIMPPVEACKSMDQVCETPKADVVAKPAADIPEPPKPIIVPPIMPPAKLQSFVPSPYGSVTKMVTTASPQVTVTDLPKPADLPKPIEMPKAVVEVSPITAGKSSVTDIVAAKTPDVIDLPKPMAVAPIESPKIAPPVAPIVEAPKMELPVAPVVDAPKPAKLELPVAPIVEAPKPAKLELPIAPVLEAPKPAPAKVERFTSPTPTPVPSVKPVTYTPEPSGLKSVKEPISITLDAETARRAVEDICRGAGTDLKVTAGAGRQLTVALKVASQGEWERLYTKIKALPEINGYSVIYNAQVEGSVTKVSAAAAPTPEAEVVKTSNAPMMGVLRSSAGSSSPSAEAAKAAIEKLCEGKAVDIGVRTPAGKQVAVSMKVASAADWELLYSQIKALPEIAGCSVIYNVSVK
jgi:BON domain